MKASTRAQLDDDTATSVCDKGLTSDERCLVRDKKEISVSDLTRFRRAPEISDIAPDELRLPSAAAGQISDSLSRVAANICEDNVDPRLGVHTRNLSPLARDLRP